jgi:hypothetical protein
MARNNPAELMVHLIHTSRAPALLTKRGGKEILDMLASGAQLSRMIETANNEPRLHDAEVGAQQAIDVGSRKKAADVATTANAPGFQLPHLERHAALEQPGSRQRRLVWLHSARH